MLASFVCDEDITPLDSHADRVARIFKAVVLSRVAADDAIGVLRHADQIASRGDSGDRKAGIADTPNAPGAGRQSLIEIQCQLIERGASGVSSSSNTWSILL
jgi:hypothetical protein